MFTLATLLFAGVPAHAVTPDADALGAPAPNRAPQVPLAAAHGPTAGLADLDGDGISDALQAKLAGAAPDERFDVIVTFDGPGDAASARAAVGPFQVKHAFRILRGFAAGMTAGQLRGLSHTPGIFRIEEDVEVSAHLVEARADYGADRAQTVDGDFPGYDGNRVGICVIDTGIDATHEQLAGKVDGFCDARNGGCNIDPETGAALDSAAPYDDHGHGTHVAGIAAGQGGAEPAVGQYRGVAPAARLYGAKVLGAAGSGSISDVVKGIDWCASRPGVHVLNLSLGGGPTDGNDALSLAVDCAAKPGGNPTCNDISGLTPKIVVTSAGNSGPMWNTIGTPAVAREVIAVGAMGSAAVWHEFPDRRGHLLIAFSSRGPTLDGRIKPDIAAPGTGITSARAYPAGSNQMHDGYWTLSGTSMAAPYTAGTMALMIQAMQEVDPTTIPGDPLTSADVEKLKDILFSTAQDRGPPGQDSDWGWGAIDTFLAVATAAGTVGTSTEFGRHERLEATVLDFSDWEYNFFVDDIGRPISVTVINGDARICLDGDPPCSDEVLLPSDIEAELYDPNSVLLDLSTCAGDPTEDRDPTFTFCGRAGPYGEGRQETLFARPLEIGWYTLRLYPWNGDAYDDAPQATAGVDLVYGGDSAGDAPPKVVIASPADGTTVSGSITVAAVASDDQEVTQVEFFVDGISIGIDTNDGDGWSANWATPASDDGVAYTLTATATDTINQTASDSTGVTVDNVDAPPSVSITNPVDGATVSGKVTITANAMDVEGVSQVEFFVDGNSVSVDTSSDDGWSAVWITPANDDGVSHSLTATVTDTANQAASDSIGVVIDNIIEPGIASPPPGSTLSGATETFSWVSNGAAVEFYALWFGSSQGSGDLGKPDKLPGSQLSYTKTNLPTDGRQIWVRLFWRVGGVWSSGADVQYTAASEPEPPPEPGTEPEIVSPAPGSTLRGSTETFSWVPNGAAVEFYALWFGSSQGSGDLGKPDKLPGSQLSFTKSGLPTDGSPVWVRLFWRVGGVWSSGADFEYTAASVPGPEPPPDPEPGTDPAIVSPAPGSTPSGATETFSWVSNGAAVEFYALWFGSSQGSGDLGKPDKLPGSQLSYTKTNLPTDGRQIWVRLFWRVGGVWSSGADFEYTAASVPEPEPPPEPEPGTEPEIVSPAPGSTLSGSTETFSWVSNGAAVEFYALWFGSSQGSGDLGKPDKLPDSQLSFTKSGLPTDGSPVWVRLFWRVGGVWSSGADFEYTAELAST